MLVVLLHPGYRGFASRLILLVCALLAKDALNVIFCCHRSAARIFIATSLPYIYIEREREDKDYFIVRPPAHYDRSEHSGSSNSHGSNDGLKLSFLVFKALKTKLDNLSTVGAFVLANNKENLNMDGCLWPFGGISSFLKAVYFGHTNKEMYFCFWHITEWTICIPVASKGSIL